MFLQRISNDSHVTSKFELKTLGTHRFIYGVSFITQVMKNFFITMKSLILAQDER